MSFQDSPRGVTSGTGAGTLALPVKSDSGSKSIVELASPVVLAIAFVEDYKC